MRNGSVRVRLIAQFGYLFQRPVVRHDADRCSSRYNGAGRAFPSATFACVAAVGVFGALRDIAQGECECWKRGFYKDKKKKSNVSDCLRHQDDFALNSPSIYFISPTLFFAVKLCLVTLKNFVVLSVRPAVIAVIL